MKNKKQMNIVFTDEFFEDGKKEHSFNDEVVDYSIYSEMDDLEINGNSAFVIANDVENKKLIVEYVDSGEMETIDYSKPIYKSKDSTPKSKDLTPKGTIKYYTVKDALSTEILRGTISSGKGGSRRATDKEMMEVTLDEYWNYNALRNVGWSVFFTSSGQSLEFLDKADAEEYIERKRLNDVSDQYMSKGGGVGKEKKLSKALIVKILKAKGYKKAVGKTVRTPSNKRGYSYGNDVQYKFEESYIISADNYAISIEQVGGHNWNENYLAEICDVLIENGIKCKNEISYLSIIKSDWLIDDGLSSKMAKGGSLDNIKLLAPNGNPSNLTPEQYSLVRTDAFKKWFGDWENDPENSSKVIDKNGEPLQQSHFTNAKFTKFKNKESGFHFGDKSIKGDLSIAKGGDLYEELVVFLNIRNPLRVKDSHRFDPSILIEQLSNDNVISSEQYDKLSEDLYDVEENLTEENEIEVIRISIN